MTTAKTFKYRTNLSRKMSAPGGVRVGDAVARAGKGLDLHRDTAMRTLDHGIGVLEAACAAQAPGGEAAVYEQAAALLDVAGFFDTGPLYGAAFSLCDLADGMIETGAWGWPSVAVHVQALRLIFADDCRQTDGAELLLCGLASILERFRSQA